MRKALLCVTCMLLLTACGSTAANTASQTPTANPNAPPGNFLYTSSIEAMFLAWVNNNGALSGQTQDAQYGTDRNGNSTVNSTHGSFTGTLSNDQVSLNFGGFLGYANTITGTYSNNTLTLQFPMKDGSIGTFVFVPATVDQFNTALSAMQTTANNTDATATTLMIENNATSTAAVAATYTTWQQQQAVANANAGLGDALSALKTDANGLSSFNETSTINGYANDWKSMKNDYQSEVNDSHNGCANGNGSQVQADANQVQADENQINADDNQLSSDKNQYNIDVSSVQSDMQAVKSGWAQLQQAVANNSTGSPSAAYTSTDVNNALQGGQSAQNKAHGVWQSAQNSAAGYDNAANNLNNKAQALPSKMGC